MAELLSCPVCSGPVASSAKACPKCGHPIKGGKPETPFTGREKAGHGLGATGFAFAMITLLLFFLFWPGAIVFGVLGFIFSVLGLILGRKTGLAIAGVLITVVPGIVGLVLLVFSLVASGKEEDETSYVESVAEEHDRSASESSLEQYPSNLKLVEIVELKIKKKEYGGSVRTEPLSGERTDHRRLIFESTLCYETYLEKFVKEMLLDDHTREELSASSVCEAFCYNPSNKQEWVVSWAECKEQ